MKEGAEQANYVANRTSYLLLTPCKQCLLVPHLHLGWYISSLIDQDDLQNFDFSRIFEPRTWSTRLAGCQKCRRECSHFHFEALRSYVQFVQASQIVLLRLSDTSTGLHPPSNTKLDKHIVKPCICLSLLTKTETKIEPSKTKLKRHIMKRDKTQNLSTTENWNTNKEKKNKQER